MKTRARTAICSAAAAAKETATIAKRDTRTAEAADKQCVIAAETAAKEGAKAAEAVPEDYAEYILDDYADSTSEEAAKSPSEDGEKYPEEDDDGEYASGDGGDVADEAPAEHSLRTDSVGMQESVIVISDDDADYTLGNSVLIIEDPFEKSLLAEKRSEELVDEELAITFTRSGDVMPHARYDCMAHPFVRTECDTSAPLEKNADVCDQCYCYLCDKLALQCTNWTTTSVCHCNAHNKSTFWKSKRDSALAGILTIFDFDLTEIDADLRHGGFLLLTCMHELSAEYNRYLMGARVSRDRLYSCTCSCHRGPGRNFSSCHVCHLYHSEILIHSYSEVYKKAEGFINKADTENPKSAAVLLLGLAKELILQKEPPLAHQLGESTSILRPAIAILLGRILSSLQKMLVLCGFPKNLYDKFIRFFQSLPLPPYCYTFTNSLNVIPWDDLFLITILLGQNITGQRTKKGKKEFLFEALPVIQARVQKMEEEEHYKQLVRYLKAVRCSDMLALKYLRERIPFYMCKTGNFMEAAQSLIQLKCASCSININLTLSEFILYVKIFRTESCPSGNQFMNQEVWTSLKGIRMKPGILIKFLLRIIYANKSLVQSPQCWSALIRAWCSSPVLGPKGQLEAISYDEPPIAFQRSVMDVSLGILDELKRNAHVNLPPPFSVMPNEAELILIVRALAQRLLFDHRPPSSVLDILLAFGKNIWALRDLLEAITPRNDLVYQFTNKLVDELFSEKNIVLQTWSCHGPHYMSELIYTFLIHLNALVRSVGFHMMDIVMENFNMLPWAQQIAHFLQSRVVTSFIYFTPAERNELKNKISICQSRA